MMRLRKRQEEEHENDSNDQENGMMMMDSLGGLSATTRNITLASEEAEEITKRKRSVWNNWFGLGPSCGLVSKTNNIRQCSRLCFRRFCILFVLFLCIRRIYFELELHYIKDPYLQAMFYMPVQYLSVKYIQPPSSGQIQTFHMNYNNSFVLNLGGTASKRWKRFIEVNTKNSLSPTVTRIDGWNWIAPIGIGDKLPIEDTNKFEKQQLYQQNYPFLQDMVNVKKYGDAGCTMGHILLLERLCYSNAIVNDTDSNVDYIFIFEDDVEILSPLINEQIVTGPNDADVIHLVETSTKLVKMPFRRSSSQQLKQKYEYVDRIIQGYGALGYIITKHGSCQLLKHLQQHSQPIDVALTSSTMLRIYRPLNGFPLVKHLHGISTRSKINTKK